LADELRNNFATEAELFAEGNGIFDVVVDGKLVYSKHKTGRFPKAGEVSGILNT
jgi:selT/selW/selH-like putative selenoprotein